MALLLHLDYKDAEDYTRALDKMPMNICVSISDKQLHNLEWSRELENIIVKPHLFSTIPLGFDLTVRIAPFRGFVARLSYNDEPYYEWNINHWVYKYQTLKNYV